MRGRSCVVVFDMRFFYASVLLFLSVGFSALAEEMDDRQEALIASARSGSEFDVALAEAREAGHPEGWLLEAEIVKALSSGDMGALLTLPDRIDALGSEFRIGIGNTFISAQQLDGFSDTIRCVIAYQAGDTDAFEALAVSSFSKAPSFNKLFGIGDLLATTRMEAVQAVAMEGVGVPMDLKMSNVEGETRTLRDWMGENKVMLVDFWASWCGPCIRAMPSLKAKAESLPAQGVFVAAINIDDSGQLAKANKTRDEKDMGSVPWLLDSNGGELSDLLMIDSIPRMLLIDREGKILYNGHPQDPSLGVALAKIGVTLAH